MVYTFILQRIWILVCAIYSPSPFILIRRGFVNRWHRYSLMYAKGKSSAIRNCPCIIIAGSARVGPKGSAPYYIGNRKRTYSTRGQVACVIRGRDWAGEILPRRAPPLMLGCPPYWLLRDGSGIDQRDSSAVGRLPGTRFVFVSRLGRVMSWWDIGGLRRGSLQNGSRVFVLVYAGFGRVHVSGVGVVGRRVVAW